MIFPSIGAGPAGLEAARISAERGHQVTVIEANSQAGGQVRLASVPLRRRELIGAVDWRVSECERLGALFRYNCYAGKEEILGCVTGCRHYRHRRIAEHQGA